jgi:hypothetical protein
MQDKIFLILHEAFKRKKEAIFQTALLLKSSQVKKYG